LRVVGGDGGGGIRFVIASAAEGPSGPLTIGC